MLVLISWPPLVTYLQENMILWRHSGKLSLQLWCGWLITSHINNGCNHLYYSLSKIIVVGQMHLYCSTECGSHQIHPKYIVSIIPCNVGANADDLLIFDMLQKVRISQKTMYNMKIELTYSKSFLCVTIRPQLFSIWGPVVINERNRNLDIHARICQMLMLSCDFEK